MKELNHKRIKSKPIRLMPIWNSVQLQQVKEGNLFVKNVDPSITPKEFEDFFSTKGDLVSTHLKTDDNG